MKSLKNLWQTVEQDVYGLIISFSRITQLSMYIDVRSSFYNQLKLLLYMLDSVKEVERPGGSSPSTPSIASSNSFNLEQLNPKLLNERYLHIASSTLLFIIDSNSIPFWHTFNLIPFAISNSLKYIHQNKKIIVE